MAIDEERALVGAAQKGSKKAFDLLVQKHQFKVELIVKRYIRDPHEAKDITQEVFLRAYRALNTFRSDSAFYTWLYRIAVNTAKNYLIDRTNKKVFTIYTNREDELPVKMIWNKNQDFPELNAFKEEIKVLIIKTLNGLPDDIRKAFELREHEGLSYAEIASAMSCPIGTVRSRIYRARSSIEKGVRAQLAAQGDRGEKKGFKR